MFRKELGSREESMRVQRFLALKDRPLSYLEESQLKVELTYPEDREYRKARLWTIFIILLVNVILCMIPVSTTSIIVTLVGAFTSPLVIFMLPGYLFYDQVSKDPEVNCHRYLSYAMFIIGILLLVVMTTISFYVMRLDTYPRDEPPLANEL